MKSQSLTDIPCRRWMSCWIASGEPVHLHLRPHERLLAGTADGESQAEDCLLNPQWPLAVPGSPLRPARGTSNLPEDDGHPVAAPPVLRSRIPRWRRRPLGDLGRTSGTAAEGAIGATEGWTDRQPPQVSPGPLRGEVPGLPGGAGPNPTSREEGDSDSLGPATLHQDPGTSLFGVGGILSLFHSQLLLFSFSPDRSDQEGTAGEGPLGSRRGGGLPTGEDGAHLRAHPASPRL